MLMRRKGRRIVQQGIRLTLAKGRKAMIGGEKEGEEGIT
jgi:hypothetical protein